MDIESILSWNFGTSEEIDRNILSELCNQAINLCKPSSAPNPDEEYSKCRVFFQKFEDYILPSDPTSTFSQTNNICGRVFKMKEPIYRCRDCGTDITCVLCRSCFNNSEHKYHNYELYQSGGGSCDCGDLEAWKSNPRCKLHRGVGDSNDIADVCLETEDEILQATKDIPDLAKSRFLQLSRVIFDTFKLIVMRPLCKDKDDERKAELQHELDFLTRYCPSLKLTDICVVLYNNEYHNFDQVINLFKRFLQCSPEQAMSFANIVDRDGRCMALWTTDFKDAESKQREILTRSKSISVMELLTKLHYPQFLALQNLMTHWLRWLVDFIDSHARLRVLSCFNMMTGPLQLGNKYFPKLDFVQCVLRNHNDMWKMTRGITTKFIMTVIFKESSFKRAFAVEILENYDSILKQYSNDDHNPEDSMISINCQIFTVISLAKYLLEERGVLEKLVIILHELIKSHCVPLTYCSDILQFFKTENSNKKFDVFERHMRVFTDLSYLLRSLVTHVTGIAENEDSLTVASDTAGASLDSVTLVTLSPSFVDNFIRYFEVFINLLALVQDTNTIDRVTNYHVEHDPQWRTGIILMYELAPIISLTAKLVVCSSEIWCRAFEKLQAVFIKRIVNVFTQRITFNFHNFTATVIDNEWPLKHLSVIKPLHRLMAPMMTQAKYRNMLKTEVVDGLCDQALQMIVFSSQQAGNMWILNGSVPYILSQQMKCLSLNPEMYERDLQILQQLAAHMEPTEFIVKCIHKFGLLTYLDCTQKRHTDMKPILQQAEDFLHLLILTLFYRHRLGVATGMTQQRVSSYVIFHILCIKPMPHSKIMKKLPVYLQKSSRSLLLNLMDEVSDQSKVSQATIFNPKTSLIPSTFDKFCPFYTIQDRNEAEINVSNLVKKDGQTTILEPPEPLELTDDYAGLYNFFSSPCLIKVLANYLGCCNKAYGVWWTDMILDMVFYIIGQSLQEDLKLLKSGPVRSRILFIEACSKFDENAYILTSLETLCDKVTTDQQLQLLKWTIRKWYEVKRIAESGNPNAMEVDETIDNSTIEPNNSTKTFKADAAKRRRELLINKMMSMQKKFMAENCSVAVEMEGTESGSPQTRDTDPAEGTPTGIGPAVASVAGTGQEELVCILCQERDVGDEADSADDDQRRLRPMVAIGGAWRSNVLSNLVYEETYCAATATGLEDDSGSPPYTTGNPGDRRDSTSPIEESNFIQAWMSADNADDDTNSIEKPDPRFIIPLLDQKEDTFITTCGHVMHYDCKTRYVNDMVKQKQTIARTKGVLYPHIHNRCPLCKCVCNIDIPIIRNCKAFSLNLDKPDLCYREWLAQLKSCEIKKPVVEIKKTENILTSLKNNFLRMVPLAGADRAVSANDNELLLSLANKASLATRYQPARLKKDTYMQLEKINAVIYCSTPAEQIEFGYSIAYTLTVWEKTYAKQGASFLHGMSERHSEGLTHLVRAVCLSHSLLARKDGSSCQFFWGLLQQLLLEPDRTQLTRVWDHLYSRPNPIFILETDYFYILCSLLFMRHFLVASVVSSSAPSASSAAGVGVSGFLERHNFHRHVTRLVTELVTVQILLSLSLPGDGRPGLDIEHAFARLQDHHAGLWAQENVQKLVNLRKKMVSMFNCEIKAVEMTDCEVVVSFTQSIMSFLRCATFILKIMGTVTLEDRIVYEDEFAETSELMLAIGLDWPGLLDELLLQTPPHIELALLQYPSSSSGRQRALAISANRNILPLQMPLRHPQLIELPNDFSDVITRCLEEGCFLNRQATGTVFELALCLLCGRTVCLSGYCCRRMDESSQTTQMVSGLPAVSSGAQVHARRHHRGFSLYLGTRASHVVVLFYRARWHIQLPPVYIDRFGESDPDLTRGNPLFLDHQAYQRLERGWLQHSVGTVVQEAVYFSNDFFI